MHATDQIEALEEDYLYIATSQIPNSGNGLHTAISIYKDEVISIFLGQIISEIQIALRVKNNLNQYFIAMLDGTIMDSQQTVCFAKYANDAGISNFKNNSKIALSINGDICLIATRKIKAGEEIFCSYGKRYWAGHGVIS